VGRAADGVHASAGKLECGGGDVRILLFGSAVVAGAISIIDRKLYNCSTFNQPHVSSLIAPTRIQHKPQPPLPSTPAGLEPEAGWAAGVLQDFLDLRLGLAALEVGDALAAWANRACP